MAAVTIREAARRLGVSEDTVRRRMRRGDLVGVREDTAAGFRWLVEVPEEGPEAEAGPTGSAELLEVALAHERDVRALLERELEARRREVSELHVLLQNAQRLLPAPTDPDPLEASPSSGRRLSWRERLRGRVTG